MEPTMARLLPTLRRLFSSKTLINGVDPFTHSSASPSSFLLCRTQSYVTQNIPKSPFDANILRILRTEIDYQSEYAPPQQPVAEFNSFTVEDRPGEQWMIMRQKFRDSEDMKIEVTMFDGLETVTQIGDDGDVEDVRLHISLLVDISKGKGFPELEFVCSAWPDCLEVQKVYVLRRDKILARPYMGPDFGSLNYKLQKELREFLEARGVNNELAVLLHNYMTNKDRTELIGWLGNVRSFVEK